MKGLLVFAIATRIIAQQAAPPPVPAVAAVPAATVAATTPAASPVPAAENWLTGYIEVGYSGRTDVGGSLSAYRSVVNLGSGLKLLSAEFSIVDPKHRLFDQIDVRAFDWGSDPYSTVHVDIRKGRLYRFGADYRSLAYYSNLPSFADPQPATGITLSEQSFDSRRHLGTYNLEFFPGGKITPYLSFDRDSSSGQGISSFVDGSANEYAVPNTTSDHTSLYRGGVRIALKRLFLTLEEGGTTYSESQNTYVAPGNKDSGDTTSTYLGQPLYLSSLLQAYGIHGSSAYSKALLAASPFTWLDISGQFVFSQASNTVNYQQNDSGSFAEFGAALLVTSEQYLLQSAAKLPHTTATLSGEMRPLKHIRVMESWMTDRLHNAGSSNALVSNPQATPALLASTLANNYNQQETDLYWDATTKLMVRGGYRYVWGDGDNLVLPAAGLFTTEHGTLRAIVGLAGVVYRPSARLSLRGDLEAASSSGVYFRTSLYNYQKIRAQMRYQLLPTVNLSADASFLNNSNPLAGANYNYHVMQEALAVQWLPTRIKAFSFQGAYERSSLYSDISYLIPQTLSSASSLYRENVHSLTALVSANLPFAKAKISAGGSAMLSTGTRPTTYYQPVAKISAPLGHHVNLFAEWRYYGFGETYFAYEDFRTHLFTAGLRYTK